MSIYKGVRLFPSLRNYTKGIAGWTKYVSNPVIDVGANAEWDDYSAYASSVILDGSTYKIWYVGHDGADQSIGYASSGDGITWTKLGSLISKSAGFDSNLPHNPSVIKEGPSDYKMWYSGYNGSDWSIGYATSGTGVNWTKYGSNPVLEKGTGGQWDDTAAYQSSVILDGGTYKMWYAGNDGTNRRIGLATSGDGTTWTKSGSNPVLDIGTGGQWDDRFVYNPCVIKDGPTDYKMWYTGDNTSDRILGYATSGDGITWTKSGLNPILDVGASETWENNRLTYPSVINDGGIYKIWYSGDDGTTNRIGLATSY